MRNILIAAAAVSAACLASSAPAAPPVMPPTPLGPPRLVIVISVDQLSADLFDDYRAQFTGGLARLARGAVFRNGYQAHAATETCPGHSTILTGMHPANNGIVANNWVDQSIARPEKSVYCAEDESRPRPSGPASYVVSAAHLRAATLGDRMKQAWPQSLNVALAAKDRSAVMMGGRRPDQRWFWDGRQFVTDLKPAAAPAVVARTNAGIAATIAAPREALAPPPICQAKSTPVALTNTLTVGNHRFARAAGDSVAFRTSPEMDGAVLALAAGLVQDLRLGRDSAPDLLSIGLSATDYVGHAYGPGGGEMCLHLLSLDRDLGDFFRLLDGQRIDYSVVLTADHGQPDIPERLRARGKADSTRADPALATAALGKAIGTALGLAGPVLLGELAGDVYFDRGLAPADRRRAEQAALAFYRAHPQVARVFTAAELRSVRIPARRPDRWTLAQRVRASFDPRRSGDLYVVLKPNVMPIPVPGRGYAATHGSPWDADRRVPILFWRAGIAAANRNEAVATIDILPTLEAQLRLQQSRGIDGTCLAGISGILCPTR